uniref:Large ribosomal subunit protein uL18c n=1 Tax=Gossypium raimondii TaxID=29730 RepID=A0A0D2QUV2_GOSRA|nr:hypothetical protein B456_004G096600 [Gossypium raimondii]
MVFRQARPNWPRTFPLFHSYALSLFLSKSRSSQISLPSHSNTHSTIHTCFLCVAFQYIPILKPWKAGRQTALRNLESQLGMAITATAMTMTVTTGLQFAGSLNHKQTSFLGVPLRLSMSNPQPSLPSVFLNVQAKARTRTEDREARHSRIRKKIEGTPDRPRLCVFRSNKHLYVQVIDDSKMHTLASASTMQKPICEEFNYTSGPTIEVAKKVGEFIAKSCLEKGITKVAFDRGGYPYHGRVQALADSAREHGLQF